MHYHSSNSSYRSGWSQPHPEQSSGGYVQSINTSSSRNRPTSPQPGTDYSYHQYQSGDSRYSQHSVQSNSGVPRGSYAQSTATLGGTYAPSHLTNGFAYHPAPYNESLPQYGQQYGFQVSARVMVADGCRSQGWPNPQQGSIIPGHQGMVQSPIAASPSLYAAPSLPPVAPRG